MPAKPRSPRMKRVQDCTDKMMKSGKYVNRSPKDGSCLKPCGYTKDGKVLTWDPKLGKCVVFCSGRSGPNRTQRSMKNGPPGDCIPIKPRKHTRPRQVSDGKGGMVNYPCGSKRRGSKVFYYVRDKWGKCVHVSEPPLSARKKPTRRSRRC